MNHKNTFYHPLQRVFGDFPQMATGIPFLGFNDRGRSVTTTFLYRNRFYLQLSPHRPKMNKKINVGS